MKRRLFASAFASLLALLLLGAATSYAQKTPSAQQPVEGQATRQVPTSIDLKGEADSMENTRNNFIQVLRFHPRLLGVVYHDPSLLSDPDYIRKNAPELWTLLEQHPEIAQNPEFFLGQEAARMHESNEGGQGERGASIMSRLISDSGPFLVFLTLLIAVLWLVKVLLENRRWSRIAKVQAEVHTKLMEKFASSQELQAYMETEAGKRFLESAPIAIDLDQRTRVSAPLGRILWSVQVGFILTLGGIGLLALRAHVPDAEEALLVFGTLGVTLGVGFLFSAVAAYVLSRHLGLFEHAKLGPIP